MCDDMLENCLARCKAGRMLAKTVYSSLQRASRGAFATLIRRVSAFVAIACVAFALILFTLEERNTWKDEAESQAAFLGAAHAALADKRGEAQFIKVRRGTSDVLLVTSSSDGELWELPRKNRLAGSFIWCRPREICIRIYAKSYNKTLRQLQDSR